MQGPCFPQPRAATQSRTPERTVPAVPKPAHNYWDHLSKAISRHGALTSIVTRFPFILAHEPINRFIPALPQIPALCRASTGDDLLRLLYTTSGSSKPSFNSRATRSCCLSSAEEIHSSTFQTWPSLVFMTCSPLSSDLTQNSSSCPQFTLSLFPFQMDIATWCWWWCLVLSSLTTHLHLPF